MTGKKNKRESKRCCSLQAGENKHCNFVENTDYIIHRKFNCETIFPNELTQQFFGHTEKEILDKQRESSQEASKGWT